jgi:hypothetical protein
MRDHFDALIGRHCLVLAPIFTLSLGQAAEAFCGDDSHSPSVRPHIIASPHPGYNGGSL